MSSNLNNINNINNNSNPNKENCTYCKNNQPHPKKSRHEVPYACGYKPFHCVVCNYSSSSKGNLTIHMQSDKHMNNVRNQAINSVLLSASSVISSSNLTCSSSQSQANIETNTAGLSNENKLTIPTNINSPKSKSTQEDNENTASKSQDDELRNNLFESIGKVLGQDNFSLKDEGKYSDQPDILFL